MSINIDYLNQYLDAIEGACLGGRCDECPAHKQCDITLDNIEFYSQTFFNESIDNVFETTFLVAKAEESLDCKGDCSTCNKCRHCIQIDNYCEAVVKEIKNLLKALDKFSNP